MAHEKSEDETDFDQSDEGVKVEGHEFIVHEDEDIDQDEGY